MLCDSLRYGVSEHTVISIIKSFVNHTYADYNNKTKR